MSDFSIPTNIKQIGTIGEGLRIYMEDYVCTYLFQFAESGGYDERAALLVGKFMVIDGQPVLFVNGAVQGKYAEEKNGLLYFTEKTDNYVNAMIAEFFEGMEVVGWMQSQPSYGIYLNQHYAAYHQRIFTQAHQVMFVMDPLERINTFYAWNNEHNGLTEIKGYFIYYDKNRGMHEYMLRNKNGDYKTQPPSFVEVTRMERAEDAEERDSRHQETADSVWRSRGEGPRLRSTYDLRGAADSTGDSGIPDNPEEIIRRHQAERTRRRTHHEQRRTMNLLVSLSAVLFVVCFVMGAGLIQNQDRIAKMENQLSQLSTAYRNLFVQLSGNNTESVFAAQIDANTVEGIDPAADVDPTAITDPTAATNPGANTDPTAGTGSTTVAEPLAGAESTAGTEPAQVIEENGAATTAEASAASPAQPETAAPAAATSNVPETYTIQPGDSLIAISIRFYGENTRVNDILTINGIDNADHIVAGKTIVLPRP